MGVGSQEFMVVMQWLIIPWMLWWFLFYWYSDDNTLDDDPNETIELNSSSTSEDQESTPPQKKARAETETGGSDQGWYGNVVWAPMDGSHRFPPLNRWVADEWLWRLTIAYSGLWPLQGSLAKRMKKRLCVGPSFTSKYIQRQTSLWGSASLSIIFQKHVYICCCELLPGPLQRPSLVHLPKGLQVQFRSMA